ncbi:MAG: 16S rRNA (cytidine(1402)-2'-O)-methyltransferase [Patescibacteria group bacterium]
MDKGKLYVVATPIGNLGDITLRALAVLKSVDFIACEDTRISKKLLDHYGIATKMISYHQHSGAGKIGFLIDILKEGKKIALITDAGTPGISDPGNKLIAEVVEKLGDRYEIISIPGASAVAAALSVSGLPTDKFLFLGFLPHKKGRETIFKRILESNETIVFYESTHRIEKTLERLIKLMPERKMVICRELTKKFETIYRGTAREILDALKKSSEKGEFVVIIRGR